MKRVIFVTDLHIHNDDTLDDVIKLCEDVRNKKPDVFILGGDILDPWMATWDVLLETQSWKEIKKLVKERYAEGYKTIWFPYNHDYGAKPDYLPGAELKQSHKEGKWLFLHGWEFDIGWGGMGGLPGIAPLAFWIATHCPQIMIHIFNFLYGKDEKARSLSRMKAIGDYNDDWTLKVHLLHGRAMQYAKKHKLYLAIGHTHCPTPFNNLIIDAGDGVDSYTHLDIEIYPTHSRVNTIWRKP